jgi:ABC-2 type transport system ATP-binding protein
MAKAIDFWERIAGIYDEEIDGIFGNDLRPLVLERLRMEKDLGRTVEFGCGTGYYTQLLAGLSQSVVATDISEKMLDRTRERIRGTPEVEVRHEDCEKTSFPEASFDTVFLGLTFQVVDGPRTIAEMKLILKPGGKLIIAIPTMEGLSFPEKIRGIIRNYRAYGRLRPPGTRLYTKKSMETLILREGFRPDDIMTITDPAHPGGFSGLYVRAVRP